MNQLIDGTVSYGPCADTTRTSDYELRVRFSEVIAPLTLFELDALQARHGGSLDMYPEGDGSSLHVSKRVVAYGPESAALQAEDLRNTLLVYTGLSVNVARGLGCR